MSFPIPVRAVRYPPGWKPSLVVVIDTEEEFDWGKPLDRASTAVTAMRSVGKAQAIFDQYGIRPCYVIDYPVATQASGAQPLREIQDSGRCEIGAHLHPWVTPPHEEAVNARNSYTMNLPRELAAEKLRRLGAAIESAVGRRPVSYKAGRYGIGGWFVSVLKEQGYTVDLSTAPPFDYRDDGGPDFTESPLDTFWMGGDNPILSLPTTGAFAGWAGGGAAPLYRAAASKWGMRLRAPGILARLGAVDRLRLSPEEFTAAEHRKLTRFLLGRGVGVFTFSFHSPSLEPGHTPYVRTQADLEAFLDMMKAYFDYFLGELGGVTLTPAEVAVRLGEEPPGGRGAVDGKAA